ncbi:MAG: GNAT family N-acetyltransferase [Actinomycetota bacterium]
MQTAGSQVRTATGAGIERVIAPIVLAFATDPLLRYFFPEPATYIDAFTELARSFARTALEHEAGHHVESFVAAALWFPPGVEPDREALGPLFERTIDAKRLQGVFEVVLEKAKYHPEEPHWYLQMIGVDPHLRGRGYGSALLSHALERIDEAHEVACLDSSNPANVPLYERYGFEVVATVEVADAPPVFPMVRRAR